MKVLQPLIDRIEADVMSSDLLHADDTPIRVLDRGKSNKGLGKGVSKGRIWAYVRDQRPWKGEAPPAALYAFAPDWKEIHVQRQGRTPRFGENKPATYNFGLVEAVDVFRQSVVVIVADTADGRFDTSFAQSFGVANR